MNSVIKRFACILYIWQYPDLYKNRILLYERHYFRHSFLPVGLLYLKNCFVIWFTAVLNIHVCAVWDCWYLHFTHNYTAVFKILGHVTDLKGLINPDTWLSPRTNSKDHQGNSKTTLPGKLPHPTEDNTTGPVKNNLEVGYSCWQWEENNSGIILSTSLWNIGVLICIPYP